MLQEQKEEKEKYGVLILLILELLCSGLGPMSNHHKAGSDEFTVISFSTDVKINGHLLVGESYAFFIDYIKIHLF